MSSVKQAMLANLTANEIYSTVKNTVQGVAKTV